MVKKDDSTVTQSASRRSGGATRGFLFCDLRGYTAFVDEHGAPAAAALLERYRALVRAAVAEHDGAEIRTEGDSFYVVFDSVSEALACGLDIVIAAREASAPPAQPIRVGVGVHAGETVETAEGYVGQSINIAARLCSLAPAGEVFVTDTVRALTQGVVPVRFASRGRRRLKGVSEAVNVYAVATADSLSAVRGRRFDRRTIVALGALAALALVALSAAGAFWLGQQPASGLAGKWKIGVSLPLSGDVAEFALPLDNAVQLAVSEAKTGDSLPGVQLVVDSRDAGGGEFGEDEERSAANAAAFVADESVIAMIGPWGSFVAFETIPITNEAGLLQCSPSNTDPGLTKPRAGADDLRDPERINYVRLPAAADVESAAGASFAFHDLGATTALVIDTQQIGKIVADGFQREFEALGGTVVRRALNPGASPSDLLTPLDTGPGAPTLVFFGGFTQTGAAEVKRALVDSGHADIPFLGWDGLLDGSGADEGSFINLAGEAAAGAYVSHPSVGIIEAGFGPRYRAVHGPLPEGADFEYTAAAYACVEIILQALEAAAASGTPPEGLREALRTHVVNTENEFETIVGEVSFDRNGDSLKQIVGFYRVDPNAAGGTGDWAVLKQEDFGTPR
jgi:branched-chain amino acid transport system substrate-binding protein